MDLGSNYRNLLAAICCFGASCLVSSVRAEDFVFHHEHVLGTSLEIQLTAETAAAANAAEAKILHEIERQAKIFSSYDMGSELSRWSQSKVAPQAVSPELFAIMQSSAEWQRLSRGAFNPATEALTKVWKKAADNNQLPTQADLSTAVKLAGEKHWQLDSAANTATHLSHAPLTFNAIAKGYIVEAACNVALRDAAEVQGLIVNLGGDLRVCGDAVRQISIADPLNAAENAPGLTTIFVNNRAVATSGNYRRGWKIGEKWYSHIIDPRNGQPVEQVISATVIAQSSATADALATICNVLPPQESIALVESQNAACLLVTKDGEQHKSAGWSEFEQPQLFRFAAALAHEEKKDDKPAAEKNEAPPAAAGEALELEVKFELDRPGGGGYRRPYVAVWLENADEFPVRTGLLFMMTKGNGSRWHRDLLRWYRQDNVRKTSGNKVDLISTISSASRGPGEYKTVFDGKDDAGKPLKPGKYTLFIEVAREHGTHQIIRQPIELGTTPINSTQMKPNVEIKSASFEYRKPAPKAAGK